MIVCRFVVLGWCLCLVSCHNDHTAVRPAKPLPSLDMVRSRLRPAHPLLDPPVGLLYTTRLTLPLEDSTEKAWDQVDQSGLPPSTVEAWWANGLRVGVLSEKNRDGFFGALQSVQGRQNQQITLTHRLTPILSSPPLTGPVQLTVIGPTTKAQTAQLASGHCQLLARVVDDKDHHASLELVPHHYKPRLTVHTRSPQDKALDGHFFDSLSVRLSLPADGFLVIGLRAPESSGEHSELSPKTAATQPDDPRPNTSPAVTDIASLLPNHLGRTLLTASRYGKPVQILMLIAVGG